MEYCGIHVEFIWNDVKYHGVHGFHGINYSGFHLDSREIFYGILKFHGVNMETYTKMAGLSAKNIPYGIHGIHMELASIPPGICLECGGTVKTSS